MEPPICPFPFFGPSKVALVANEPYTLAPARRDIGRQVLALSVGGVALAWKATPKMNITPSISPRG